MREVVGWLERADPPKSDGATPTLEVVRAIAWHLRVGGGWRALSLDIPPWRTVYSWFRRWPAFGLFDCMMHDRAGRLDVAATRITCAAVLATTKALINPL